MRALWSQTSFLRSFLERIFRFLELDIYKCPKMKTQFTFGFLFVTESFANFLVLLLLPYFITKNENTINYHFFSVISIKFVK